MFLGIIILIGVLVVFTSISLLISFNAPNFWPMLKIACLIINIGFVVLSNIPILWKIFFIACYLVSVFDRYSDSVLQLGGVMLIVMLFLDKLIEDDSNKFAAFSPLMAEIYESIPYLHNIPYIFNLLIVIIVFVSAAIRGFIGLRNIDK